MLQAMPGQMVLGRVMILNTPFVSDWIAISGCKKKLIDKKKQIGKKSKTAYV